MGAKAMNRRTRLALDLLQEHKTAWVLASGPTSLDGRRKADRTLKINHKTADALVTRGLAVYITDADGFDLIELVEEP